MTQPDTRECAQAWGLSRKQGSLPRRLSCPLRSSSVPVPALLIPAESHRREHTRTFPTWPQEPAFWWPITKIPFSLLLTGLWVQFWPSSERKSGASEGSSLALQRREGRGAQSSASGHWCMSRAWSWEQPERNRVEGTGGSELAGPGPELPAYCRTP